MINAVADRMDNGLSFEAAYAPLAEDIDALFEKWAFVALRYRAPDPPPQPFGARRKSSGSLFAEP